MRVQLVVVDYTLERHGERLGVPAVEEDTDPACRRKRLPVAPGWRMQEIDRGRLAERHDAYVPRIHPCGERVGGLAATRAVDAGNENQYRTTPRLREIVLCVEKCLAQARLVAFVRCLGQLVTEFCGFEQERATRTACVAETAATRRRRDRGSRAAQSRSMSAWRRSDA